MEYLSHEQGRSGARQSAAADAEHTAEAQEVYSEEGTLAGSFWRFREEGEEALDCFGPTSPPIHEALSLGAFDCGDGALSIGAGSLVVSEVKLDKVAPKVLATHMVVNAIDATVVQPEVTLDGVGGIEGRSDIFLLAGVIDHAVPCEIGGNWVLGQRVVRHEECGAVHMHFERGLEGLGGNVRNMERAHFAVTLNEREHGSFASPAMLATFALVKRLVLFLAAHKRFVRLYNFVGAAKRAWVRIAHSFADTVRHEPRGFVGDAKHTVQLVRAHALLAGGKQLGSQHPLVEWDFGSLIDGPDRDAELLSAGSAVEQSWAMRLAFKAVHFFRFAAMRAVGAIRPADVFHMCAGGFLVVENGV